MNMRILTKKHASKDISAVFHAISYYRNVPKFSGRQVWANSADPDQTAPRGVV